MKILIAEDDADSRLVLQKNLEGAGHQVEAAANGEDALARAKKSPPDLIISDILMPVLDGYKLCYEVKNAPDLKRIPFVFYTATYIDPEDERLAVGLGASRFIVKPVEPAEFLRLIEEVIAEAQRQGLTVPEGVQEDQLGLFRMYDASLSRKLQEKIKDLGLYRMVFDNSTEAVAIVDDTGRLLRHNKAQGRLLGYSEEELIGSTPYRYLDERTAEIIRDALAKDSIASGEGTAQAKDGTFLAVEYSIFPILDEFNKISAQVWILRDINERKALTVQLLQSQKMEAIGKLAGGVAHDFNNLLSVILGYVEMALYKLPCSDPLAHDLRQVESAAKRATNLVRQLLLFSRQQPSRFVRLELNKALTELLRMLKRIIGEDIHLELACPENCWDIEADAGNIDQIIMNLAVNARDAMPKGGNLSIRVENVSLDYEYCQWHLEARPGNFVRLSVSDDGSGIKPELMPHIFEPFFTTREVGKGTGLGLAVVYGLVKSHKGWINVYSEPGQGTTFRLYFPALLPADGRFELSGGVSSEAGHGHGERILVVEDDETIQELVVNALSKAGYLVSAAGSAEDGLERFEDGKGEFDLVFSDVILPGMNGVELVEELRVRRPGIGVLLCSGYADQRSHWPLISERGYRFLEKPFTLSAFLCEVRRALDHCGR